MLSLQDLQDRVASQKLLIPSLYGGVDFSQTPERFTADLNTESMLPLRWEKDRATILANTERVERVRAYTMLGDIVADAYAALIPEYGFRRLNEMLERACTQGLDAVKDAPPALVALIADMERVPPWVDMKLVREGARQVRIYMATVVPLALRGAFIATFMNKYSGMPMALTGALGADSAVQRVKETASFFTTACLPGALDRYGPGFRAAAMVRLMHSMVRFNILKRSKQWDVGVYGIPIPQIDQMPAGTLGSVVNALQVLRSGRRHFNRAERATIEFNRYQCHLLGLPDELLADTPQGILDGILLYAATLREGYDEATNGALVQATMKAYLPPERNLSGQIFNYLEKTYSKVFFAHTFQVKPKKVRQMHMQPAWSDYLLFSGGAVVLTSQVLAHQVIRRVPVAGSVADKLLVRRLNQLLVSYGHPEYTTDAAQYAEHRV